MGKAIIFCAPSGAGKTTIVKHLVRKLPDLKFSVSATTREMRKGIEENGRDYYFLSYDEFQQKLQNNALYEWQEVYLGTFYGTLRSEVEKIWAGGNHVIFDVDVVGGVNLKKAFGENALSVFVSVDGVDTLRHRLKKRETETEASLEKRVEKAADEMKFADQFDYVLINSDLDEALAEAEKIVKAFLE